MERRYGSFSRSIDLPASVDTNKVTAECKNGVLEITMQKKEGACSGSRFFTNQKRKARTKSG